eukprot:CAMPEP_0119316266 /NCGR_PEP_ID=MMETSP1333-20130426/39223_1 /TAXON_ID=418940 /ORGANISM="Scyphosphaera apsteinii, Strain RCC1455" /LENGTH=425 /DNA_ID=CAMNT_0007321867 /DNA_START=173 /DNA_END=1450 /DNA_ORIENTATION=-
MRYWLQAQTSHCPKTRCHAATQRFVSYEPWPGGFNNVRMSLEMAAALAFALNRTLVWSPASRIYLRGNGRLEDYFDSEAVRRGLSVISYADFMHAMGLPLKAGTSAHFTSLGNVTGVRIFERNLATKVASKMIFCVPHCPRKGDVLFESFEAYRQKLQPFDTDAKWFSSARVLHFRQNLLGNFYNFVWTTEAGLGAQIKRLVRDHLHFREAIVERAERVIAQLGGHFAFSCLHIRRNDFQYKRMRIPARRILRNTRGLFMARETLYIATDEQSKGIAKQNSFSPAATSRLRNHSWFAPLSDTYTTAFLSNFFAALENDTEPNLIGCIEQLVCSRARVFSGTYFSTFTSYIHRLRGYMADVRQKGIFYNHLLFPDDYRNGPKYNGARGAGSLGRSGPSWSVFPTGHPFWGREYVESWEDTEISIFR